MRSSARWLIIPAASAPRGVRAKREAKAPASAWGVAITSDRMVQPRDRRERSKVELENCPRTQLMIGEVGC